MNKKIVGFVLAMCLAVGLGSSSFARIDVGNVGDGFVGNASDGGIIISMTADNNDMDEFANQTKGNLVSVFGYAAGQMTYVANKTSIQFYDANGFRAGYSVVEGDDGQLKYTMTNINLSSADWDVINACKDEYENAVKNATGDDKKNLQDMGLLGYFLTRKLGIAESALKTVRTNDAGQILDKNGKPVTDEADADMVYAAWLTDKNYGNNDSGINAVDWLGEVNRTVSITLGGSDPQITLSENGKTSAVYGSYHGEAYLSQKYNYNSAGFATTISSFALESKPAEADDNGNATLKLTPTTTTIHLDNSGRQSYVTDSDGKKTAEYTYTANGSMESYKNLKTGDTTWYAGGQVSHITNKEGAIISEYNYENGILKTVQSFNNGTVTSTTVFDSFGRQLGTVNGNVAYDKAVAAIKEVRETGKVSSDCIVTSYSVYNDQISKMSSAAKEKYFGDSNYTASKSQTYGFNSAIRSVQVANPSDPDDETKTQELAGKHYWVKGSDGKWKEATQKEYEKASKENRAMVEIKEVDGIACMSEEDAKTLCKVAGINYADSGYKKLGDIKGGSDKLKSDKNKGLITFDVGTSSSQAKADTAKKIFRAFGIDVPDNVASKSFKAGGKTLSGGHYLGSKYTLTKHDSGTLTVTTLAQGISIKQTQTDAVGDKSYKTLGNYTWTSDPAVAGNVNRIESANGHKYVILNNAKVDFEDGRGFATDAKEGEEVWVCIDDLSDEEIAQLKPGSTFAAAGYIDADMTKEKGALVIDKLYARKISQDSSIDKMVQSFSAELAKNETYQENTILNTITFAKAAGEGRTYNDIMGGAGILIDYASGQAPAIF